jgi:predicted nucleic acid-binding Zn ribbon protein
MHCKYHNQKHANNICPGCGEGLCNDCSQAIMLGEYYCYGCSLFISESSKKKKWIPINYVIYAAIVSILVMVFIFFFPR